MSQMGIEIQPVRWRNMQTTVIQPPQAPPPWDTTDSSSSITAIKRDPLGVHQWRTILWSCLQTARLLFLFTNLHFTSEIATA